MKRDRDINFAGKIQSPEVARKQVIDIGKVARTPPSVGIFESPTRCFVVNVEWWSHIAGMVHWLADVASWQDAEDESYFAIKEILRFMQGMECMDFQLRQSPDDNCILEQSLDGGTTWTDVFDFSLCNTIQDKSYQVAIQNEVVNVQQSFLDIYNDYSTNYAGFPGDVHANLAPPTGDDSALRAALCNALIELVNKACGAAVDFYTESVNQSQAEANFLLAVAAFTLTALALAAAIPTAGASLVALGSSATLIAAGVGLGAGLANYLVDFWQQHTIDQFQDESAKEDVACFLFDCLDGGDASLADFQACLTGTIAGANQQAILDFLEILFQHDSTYAAFLEKWSNNEEFAQAGIELHCPCLTGYQVWVWEFKNGLGDFTLERGELVAGRVTADDATVTDDIQLTMPFDSTWRVRAVKIFGERINGIVHGSQDKSSVTLRLTPGTQAGAIASPISGGFGANGVFERCQEDTVAPGYWTGANELYVALGVSNNGGLGEIYFDRIEIQFVEGFAKGGYVTDDDNFCV